MTVFKPNTRGLTQKPSNTDFAGFHTDKKFISVRQRMSTRNGREHFQNRIQNIYRDAIASGVTTIPKIILLGHCCAGKRHSDFWLFGAGLGKSGFTIRRQPRVFCVEREGSG